MRSSRLLIACAAFALACGDASTIGSDHWGGIGGGQSGDTDPGSVDTTDSGATTGGDAGVIAEGGSQTQSFQVMTDKTSYDVELRAKVQVQVTIAPQGFTGTVNLAVSGLSTGVTGAFSPTSVSVSGTTGATSMLTLTTLESVIPAATPFTVTATSGSTTATAAPSLNVMPQITIQIPNNVEAMAGTGGTPSTDAFGNYPITINAPANFGTNNPIVVKFLNLDSAPHCIHASNPTQGFPHDTDPNGVCSTPMQKNQMDSTAHNVNTKGSYLFYLHDEGDTTDGMIKIQ
ncbi:MAG TPA: hypothetical protein VGH28_30815 [Polyangiaceae bacterium]|jgi:hypothetical protein